jgi:hypothetical protein
MHAQFRAGSSRALTTKALTYKVSMSVDAAPVSDRKQPLLLGDEIVAGNPVSALEVVPASELASPLAPIRSVSLRRAGREQGDINVTPAEPVLPTR